MQRLRCCLRCPVAAPSARIPLDARFHAEARVGLPCNSLVRMISAHGSAAAHARAWPMKVFLLMPRIRRKTLGLWKAIRLRTSGGGTCAAYQCNTAYLVKRLFQSERLNKPLSLRDAHRLPSGVGRMSRIERSARWIPHSTVSYWHHVINACTVFNYYQQYN